MAVNPALFSTGQGEWGTPQHLFDHLHSIYRFTIDLAATAENAKLPRFYTKEQDSLAQDWTGERGFLNPPYGRGVGAWVKKAYESSRQPGTLIVMLLPSRTDVAWFHDYIADDPHVCVYWVRGRLKFEGGKSSAPFPSMVVVFGDTP